MADHHDEHAHHQAQPSGLAVSEGGYTLQLHRTHLSAGREVPLRLRIVTDGDGQAVRDAFEVEHEKRLHLIVARRDTAIFRHVHPEQQTDGSWTVEVNLSDAGVYRAFADFKIGGTQHVLATDLFLPGTFVPAELPAPAARARARNVDDAASEIDVALDAPTLRAGRPATLRFTATENGTVVRLEPYLGAQGHLVALREGDLAFLHVHPNDHGLHHEQDTADAGTETAEHVTSFQATFPTPGRYRLFLQFQTDGAVRTVDYTVTVER